MTMPSLKQHSRLSTAGCEYEMFAHVAERSRHFARLGNTAGRFEAVSEGVVVDLFSGAHAQSERMFS